MPSFKYRDTPDGIATMAEALRRSPLVKAVGVGDLLQYAATNATATAWITVEFTQTVKSTAQVGLYRPRKPRIVNGKRRKDGFVYLVKADNGTYKIGKTVNPKSRGKTFNVRLPFKVEFIHTIETDDMHALEKALHLRFANKRLRGSEFFSLSLADVAFIVSLGSKCTVAEFTAKATK